MKRQGYENGKKIINDSFIDVNKQSYNLSIESIKKLLALIKVEEPKSSYPNESSRNTFDPYSYRLGNKYQRKLKLKQQEVNWLNKFPDRRNAFTDNEACLMAVMKQYVFVLHKMNEQLGETNISKEMQYFAQQLADTYEPKYTYSLGYGDIDYRFYEAEERVYLTVFRRVENSVRAWYKHKRKVSTHFPKNVEALAIEFEARIGQAIDQLIEQFQHQIEQPNLATEIELNKANHGRWKDQFAEIKEIFRLEQKEIFFEKVDRLEAANKENPTIKSLFFELSKFIAQHNKVACLQYYAKYTYYNYHLQSKHKPNKQLPKATQKLVFTEGAQMVAYRNIIIQIIQSANIEKALEEIPAIFVKQRKKIALSDTAIQQIEQKHKGTVELLNSYLEAENNPHVDTINVEQKNSHTIHASPIFNENQTILNDGLNKVEEVLIHHIAKNNFQITQHEVEQYATANGQFKNQLIEAINEKYAELLDGEALIEEDDEYYIMEKSYYNEVSK